MCKSPMGTQRKNKYSGVLGKGELEIDFERCMEVLKAKK